LLIVVLSLVIVIDRRLIVDPLLARWAGLIIYVLVTVRLAVADCVAAEQLFS